MSQPISANQLCKAIEKANDERHPAQQAYIAESETNHNELILDGTFDLNRIAEILNNASHPTN